MASEARSVAKRIRRVSSPEASESGVADQSDQPSGTLEARIVEEYLTELRDIRASGTGVAETSYYPALSNLFNAVGKTLKPKVRCVMNLKNLGAGMPDGGLFTADQFQRQSDGAPKAGQLPARGAMEAKGTKARSQGDCRKPAGQGIPENLRHRPRDEPARFPDRRARREWACRWSGNPSPWPTMNATSGNTRPRIRAPRPSRRASNSSSSSSVPAFTPRR